MKTENPIWQIGLFKKISKDEAECIVCKSKGKTKHSFKLSHASVKTLITHMGLHSDNNNNNKQKKSTIL
jgi:hypothetical protein